MTVRAARMVVVMKRFRIVSVDYMCIIDQGGAGWLPFDTLRHKLSDLSFSDTLYHRVYYLT